MLEVWSLDDMIRKIHFVCERTVSNFDELQMQNGVIRSHIQYWYNVAGDGASYSFALITTTSLGIPLMRVTYLEHIPLR